ncbi:hypothetical protein CRG98_022299 [Punica granatum]|uniref:Uncharacterized protein n=1 Tax=Punica granatum TaxID=22663 RepID=A0A2I0JN40_PUNGR|nr:hypothetical protein CRG98_022299 [Punica granatum]
MVCNRAHTNTNCILPALCIGQHIGPPGWDCPDRSELWVHLFCCGVYNLRTVWSQQCRALVYDQNADQSSGRTQIMSLFSDSMVCMGRKCYFQSFIWWGCISMVGLLCSVLLFLRTKPAYDQFEGNRIRTESS